MTDVVDPAHSAVPDDVNEIDESGATHETMTLVVLVLSQFAPEVIVAVTAPPA